MTRTARHVLVHYRSRAADLMHPRLLLGTLQYALHLHVHFALAAWHGGWCSVHVTDSDWKCMQGKPHGLRNWCSMHGTGA